MARNRRLTHSQLFTELRYIAFSLAKRHDYSQAGGVAQNSKHLGQGSNLLFLDGQLHIPKCGFQGVLGCASPTMPRGNANRNLGELNKKQTPIIALTAHPQTTPTYSAPARNRRYG